MDFFTLQGPFLECAHTLYKIQTHRTHDGITDIPVASVGTFLPMAKSGMALAKIPLKKNKCAVLKASNKIKDESGSTVVRNQTAKPKTSWRIKS